jgi:malate dehydrogenase (oxaloacetate-decarboxylating)
MTAAGGLTGGALLRDRYRNRGTAFTDAERDRLGLHGLLPPAVETLETQLDRVRMEYSSRSTDLDRHIFLRALQQTNSVLFYRFVVDNLDDLLPIVYTPTVGLACQQWSRIYRREHGLYLSWPLRHRVAELLDGAIGDHPIEVVVATDGERVLGLGDLGVGGMGIPIGKLSLYTAAGGIDPTRTLPVMLDAGTDNDALLSDPLYLGWRSRRMRHEQYDELVDAFVTALADRFPRVVLQWEDFAQVNATRLLQRHRTTLCSFNDDIQGTAAVTLAAIMSGLRATGTATTELRLVVVGAGSAGTGIARQAVDVMVRAGLERAEATSRCWLVDREGLVHESLEHVLDIQRDFARAGSDLVDWNADPHGRYDLEEVVRRVSPHALVGVSGQAGLFTESVVRAMADGTEHPIVLPLSNPTPRAEAMPADVIAWTDGRAMVGTGSPFDDVEHAGRIHPVSQVNNVHVFPGVGLGASAAGATMVTDAMIAAAADAVAELSPAAIEGPTAPLVPAIADSRRIARHVALAVAHAAVTDGVALEAADLERRIDERFWIPRYPPLPELDAQHEQHHPTELGARPPGR